MKYTFILVLGCCLGLNACYKLDLNPLSQASSENGYSSETEIEMSIKDFRTPKAEIIPLIYEDYDKAIENLPEKYTGVSSQRATKGAALALNARFALYMGDWEIAAEAAKRCRDLGIYKLHKDYADLFLSTTKNIDEKASLYSGVFRELLQQTAQLVSSLVRLI